GMVLDGVVTNVVAFGAFVDIGVHQDGLVHVSQLADRYIRDPNEEVRVGQRVKVTVISVDLPRNRIALTMKSAPDANARTSGGSEKGSGNAALPKGSGGKPDRPDKSRKPGTQNKPDTHPKPFQRGDIAPNGMRFGCL